MKAFLLSLAILFSIPSNSIVADITATEPLVVNAEVAVYSDTVLVAVLTQPIFLRSDGIALEERIQKKCQNYYPNYQILVTRDSDIYFALQKAVEKNDVMTISKLINKQIARTKQKSA